MTADGVQNVARDRGTSASHPHVAGTAAEQSLEPAGSASPQATPRGAAAAAGTKRGTDGKLTSSPDPAPPRREGPGLSRQRVLEARPSVWPDGRWPETSWWLLDPAKHLPGAAHSSGVPWVVPGLLRWFEPASNGRGGQGDFREFYTSGGTAGLPGLKGTERGHDGGRTAIGQCHGWAPPSPWTRAQARGRGHGRWAQSLECGDKGACSQASNSREQDVPDEPGACTSSNTFPAGENVRSGAPTPARPGQVPAICVHRSAAGRKSRLNHTEVSLLWDSSDVK